MAFCDGLLTIICIITLVIIRVRSYGWPYVEEAQCANNRSNLFQLANLYNG